MTKRLRDLGPVSGADSPASPHHQPGDRAIRLIRAAGPTTPSNAMRARVRARLHAREARGVHPLFRLAPAMAILLTVAAATAATVGRQVVERLFAPPPSLPTSLTAPVEPRHPAGAASSSRPAPLAPTAAEAPAAPSVTPPAPAAPAPGAEARPVAAPARAARPAPAPSAPPLGAALAVAPRASALHPGIKTPLDGDEAPAAPAAPLSAVEIEQRDSKLAYDAVKAWRSRRDAATAIALADQYLALHPHGASAEEVLSTAIDAAARTGSGETARLARRYLASFPGGRHTDLATGALSASPAR